MSDFFSALQQHAFLQYALIGGLLASICCGIVGSYVVAKRIAYLASGIAHTILGGMGIAAYLGGNPLLGALIAALGAAILIGWINLRWREHEDTLISVMWSVGMAVGIVFVAKTPGYTTDLMSYLFGNILMLSPTELYWMAILDLVLMLLVWWLRRPFLALCFDEEYARLRGVPVVPLYMLLLCMVAVTVVVLTQVVGLILVIALLTLPAAIAGQFTRRLHLIMFSSIGLGMLLTSGGLALSFGPDLPTGATIILLAGVGYLGALLLKKLRPGN